MRRNLVLTDEAARHPFLASLPPHVRHVAATNDTAAGWQLTRDDVRGFVSVYLAVFVAALAFIA